MKIFPTLNRVPVPALLAILLASIFARPISAGGPGYSLGWWTVDSGGDSVSGGSGYTLAGTAGQADTAIWQGGGYTLAGGFWGGTAVAPDGESVYLPLILKPGPTELPVYNNNTGGNLTFVVRDLTTKAEITRCTVPNNQTLPCDHNGDDSHIFPPGTYEVQAYTVCPGGDPNPIVQKTYDSGPQIQEVACLP